MQQVDRHVPELFQGDQLTRLERYVLHQRRRAQQRQGGRPRQGDRRGPVRHRRRSRRQDRHDRRDATSPWSVSSRTRARPGRAARAASPWHRSSTIAGVARRVRRTVARSSSRPTTPDTVDAAQAQIETVLNNAGHVTDDRQPPVQRAERLRAAGDPGGVGPYVHDPARRRSPASACWSAASASPTSCW